MVRDQFGLSRNENTKSPKLDPLVKSRLSPAAKSTNRELAHLQSLSLDAIGPLAQLLHEAKKGTLSMKLAAKVVAQAIQLLGNTSAVFEGPMLQGTQRHELSPCRAGRRRWSVQGCLTLLFGDGFTKWPKEFKEQVRCLDKATGSRGGLDRHQFFRGGHSLGTVRGGGNFRSRNHHHHYLANRGGKERENFQRAKQFQKKK